jgi:hypothetical protein
MADDFRAYAVGICAASVCTSLDDDEATRRMNLEHPTGIGSPWRISEDKQFRTGEPMPCPCPDAPTHRHVLFNC